MLAASSVGTADAEALAQLRLLLLVRGDVRPWLVQPTNRKELRVLRIRVRRKPEVGERAVAFDVGDLARHLAVAEVK